MVSIMCSVHDCRALETEIDANAIAGMSHGSILNCTILKAPTGRFFAARVTHSKYVSVNLWREARVIHSIPTVVLLVFAIFYSLRTLNVKNLIERLQECEMCLYFFPLKSKIIE